MDLDQPTLIAYRAYIQHQIRGDLNGVGLGPAKTPFYFAVACAIFGVLFGIVGILIITLRFRHVYLVSWNDQFLGPAFVIIFLILMSAATYLIVVAKRRSNRFRRELYFRPIGDYGVGVIHKSMLTHEHQLKSELKSGTTPHKKIMPRGDMYSHDGVKRDKSRGHENRAYDQERDDHHRRRPQGERRDDDRRRRRDGDDRRPRNGDDRRPREGGDRRPRDGDDRRPREGDDRRPREGDDRRPREGDDRRRQDDRRRYEEDRRRRAEVKRQEAEGEGPPSEERVRGRRPPKFIQPSSQAPAIVLDADFGVGTGHVDSESEL
ncbi:uncharacterized protein LOC121378504 [Gigantopelta aegis]|uniref:uncharacterized protein LOC121378504 n=1 Tax=Gigantopelta aegis TaxID=1735272 RepID=UPI001B88C4C5|nr:uncharacterized protein LOC121378504 [Gigantopelta aegis]